MEEQQVQTAKRKHEEKNRRKDPRSWENILKSAANLSDDEKFELIEKKYNELYNEFRKASLNCQTLEKQCTLLQKEKDHMQTEQAKSILARSRLENLCRELQKHNKQIKEENIAKIKEEEERRKEDAIKFTDKLSDINNMMNETKEKSGKLREENLKMTLKLTELYNEFHKREDDIAKMSHQLELERKFSQATINKMELEMKAEREIRNKEYTLIQSNLEKSEAACRLLRNSAKNLQDEVNVYKNEYADFESTMTKSNKVFDTFRTEMGTMTKQMATLQKESDSWKHKCHTSAKTIIELSEMTHNQDKALQVAEKKIEQLQKLCRQLQVDRAAFLKLLKSHSITPTTQLCVDENEKPNIPKKVQCPKKTLTKKEKELEHLKSELKAFQDELNGYLITQNENKPKSEDSTTTVANLEPDQNELSAGDVV